MRDNQTYVKTPAFIDLKRGCLGEFVHFARFHTEIQVIAFECANGCVNDYGTPERWVTPLGRMHDGEDVANGGVLGRFVTCPRCGSYKVEMLMAYPVTPREKQYWFWDLSTYEERETSGGPSTGRPPRDGEEMA